MSASFPRRSRKIRRCLAQAIVRFCFGRIGGAFHVGFEFFEGRSNPSLNVWIRVAFVHDNLFFAHLEGPVKESKLTAVDPASTLAHENQAAWDGCRGRCAPMELQLRWLPR